MNRSNMLKRFYLPRNKICRFKNMWGIPFAELSDSRSLRDLAFTVDINKHLSELNKKLKGSNF